MTVRRANKQRPPTVLVQSRIPSDLFEWLALEAEREGVSVAMFLRLLLRRAQGQDALARLEERVVTLEVLAGRKRAMRA